MLETLQLIFICSLAAGVTLSYLTLGYVSARHATKEWRDRD